LFGEIKKNEIAGIQEAFGIGDMHTDFVWGKLKETDISENVV
jgi:hypothetical protein